MKNSLNANFKVHETSLHGADVLIVIESRGGSGSSARNPDYAKQLSRILRVLQKNSCTITRIDLLSTVAIRTLKNRKLALKYPIKLTKSQSAELIRKQIQHAQVQLGQRPGAKGGNGTKRIGLFVKTSSKIAQQGTTAVLN